MEERRQHDIRNSKAAGEPLTMDSDCEESVEKVTLGSPMSNDKTHTWPVLGKRLRRDQKNASELDEAISSVDLRNSLESRRSSGSGLGSWHPLSAPSSQPHDLTNEIMKKQNVSSVRSAEIEVVDIDRLNSGSVAPTAKPSKRGNKLAEKINAKIPVIAEIATDILSNKDRASLPTFTTLRGDTMRPSPVSPRDMAAKLAKVYGGKCLT